MVPSEPGRQCRLADASLTGEQHHLWAIVDDAASGIDEDRHLVTASDQAARAVQTPVAVGAPLVKLQQGRSEHCRPG